MSEGSSRPELKCRPTTGKAEGLFSFSCGWEKGMIFISSEGNQKADGGGSGTCATANRLKNRKVKEVEEEVPKEEEKEFPVLSLNQCKCLRIEDLRAKRIEKEKDFLDYGDASCEPFVDFIKSDPPHSLPPCHTGGSKINCPLADI
ncbi:hypothetical protein RUM43_012601 [Polyplax serrata]|uniref:Uncharacterized protein n=1 Tax=Polyplax serrata TaxID=468196 RepID=A0AAN8S3Z5_POLSC